MNQKNNSKVRDFFKKEGFYFILFLCLCVVATAAAFTMKKNNVAKETNKPQKDFTLNIEEKDPSQETTNSNKQNADRVDNTQTDEVASNEEVALEEEVANTDNTEATTEEVADATEDTTQVSAGTTEVTLALPLDGLVAREFGTMIRIQENKQGTIDKTRRGVDLKASVGDVVKAAAEGQVTEVSSNPEDGTYIVIAHANGLKTKYSNLDKEVTLAVGDTVAEGDEIGKVGNTSVIFTEEVCGTVLNLQVEDANGNQVDPSKYFSF